jgi:methylenetetrahydrofolate dehydrogenase (NADP+)/methenyltetrahydrofolate cyclohydrolase
MSEPVLLDGASLARQINANLKKRATALIARTGAKPILATILVGDDPASATYVKMKGNACHRAGIESAKILLPAESITEEVIATIDELNDNPDVHGILLQHPVPEHVDESACFNAISLAKDVDGVTFLGFGRMTMGEPAHVSATPLGIIRLLEHYEIELEGKEAVVVGRSPILGKPLSMLLLNKNATVTICHSRTRDLPSVTRRADLLVGAVGIPKFIQADWVKEGVVLIDAGYNPGHIGDIDLEHAAPKSSAYTPIPGGVGPMTIVSLIEQTVSAAEKHL